MKIVGRAADFCGAKEKREENETMISMGKKAKAFFFLRSFFLTLLLLSSRFSQKKVETGSFVILQNIFFFGVLVNPSHFVLKQ